MIRVTLFLAFALWGRIFIAAQDAMIVGKISDGISPLGFVSIQVNQHSGVVSNEQGEFRVEKLSPGVYKLVFSYLGYQKEMVEEIVIRETDEIKRLDDILLAPKDIRIEEIHILGGCTGKNYNRRLMGSNSMILPRELAIVQPIGTEEMMKKMAGVNVSGDMGISNRLNVGIRGAYPRRSGNILLLEDGVPIAPAPYLAPEAYYNPPAERLDGIEVIKGVDLLLLGSNTMYGAVNYITKRPPLVPKLGVNMVGGQRGYQSAYITYGGTWNNLGAEVQLLSKSFNGFQDNSRSGIFNITTKIHADLGTRSSAYLKLNYHQENSNATYGALTPYTYRLSPVQNPFDADDLATRRYAADMVYNYQLTSQVVISTKVYASRFQRDWWRQDNTLVRVSDARSYLGDLVFEDRYSYLEGQEAGSDDWVRVGRLTNGRESARARNRSFHVAGIQETMKWKWNTGSNAHQLELGLKYHAETFHDAEFQNDSSRFARSGRLVKDNFFSLHSYSAFARNTFRFNKLSVVPAIRYEGVDMYRFDQLKIATNPANSGDPYFGSQKNSFNSLLPALGVNYSLWQSEKATLDLHAGIYRGYTPPTSGVGFLQVEDGVVRQPVDDSKIKMIPEQSINSELGIRGTLPGNTPFQLTYFNNQIKNYYSAGRSEAFQSLGEVNIQGLELEARSGLGIFPRASVHSLEIGLSLTLMQSRVVSGVLIDEDLLKAKHTGATREELIRKINSGRQGFVVYGTENQVIEGELPVEDFQKIKKLEMVFGEQGIEGYSAPYVPGIMSALFLGYSYKGLRIHGSLQRVGAQYTDYLNLENETAEGAAGKLPAYHTIDANLSWSPRKIQTKHVEGLSFYVAGKNLSDKVYIASRLHRVSSGIMPGGFRQINAGVRMNIR